MGLRISEIIEALRTSSRRERRDFSDALADAGVRLPSPGGGGSDDAGIGRFSETRKNVIDSTVRTGEDFLESFGQGMKDIPNPFSQIAESIQTANEAQKDFMRAGFTGEMFDISKAVSLANKESLKLTGTTRGAERVMSQLTSGTKAFVIAGEDLQKSLVRSSVLLQESGFNMRDFSEIVDSAAFSFNMNKQEIEGLTSTLIQVQREIPVSADEFSRNFRDAQQNFAYSADKMMDTFIGLQKMSATTGVSFDSLTRAFGSSLDTFQGSAQKAGQLNQILGKSAFNSMELLTMTEMERAEKVRNAIMESGRNVQDMGKFELLALKDTMGLGSVEEVRKFLRGDLKIDEAGVMKEVEAKDPTALKSKALDTSLDMLESRIRKTDTVFKRFALDMATRSRQATESLLEMNGTFGALRKSGLTLEQSVLTSAGSIMGLVDTSRRDRTDVMGVGRKKSAAEVMADAALKKINEMDKVNASMLEMFKKGGLAAAVAGGGAIAADSPFLTAFGSKVGQSIGEALSGGLKVTMDLESKVGRLDLAPRVPGR